jgi:hypothetical protein
MSDVQFCDYLKDETIISRFKLDEISFDYRHNKVILNGKTIALLSIDYEYEQWNGCIMIEAFEVFRKRIGLGTIIIKELLYIHKGRKFCLYSEPAAEKFWKSMGFVLGDDGTGTEMYYYGLD